jgi:two-component system CAI-1 autoinducer sensor kinase/phosphatase CqsS
MDDILQTGVKLRRSRGSKKGKGLRLKTLRYQLASAADRSKRYSERHFKLFGVIAVFLIPATTLVERVVVDPSFNTFYVRLAAGATGLLLLFHDRLPRSLQRHINLIWIACATCILPLCFGMILTLNAALTAPALPLSPIWIYQYLVALFIFIQVMNHGPLSLLMWLVSIVPLILACLLVEGPNVAALREAWLYPFPVYLTLLVIGSIANRNVHAVQTEQLRAASAIGSNIAHELRTPLASIRSIARATGRFLPDLVAGYARAKEIEEDLPEIAPHQLRELKVGLETIQKEVSYSNTIIDMLLMNTAQHPIATDEFQPFRVSTAVEEALKRFPFNNSGERKLVHTEIRKDFVVNGPKILIVHVLFNLIKNGLFFAQKGAGRLTLSSYRTPACGVIEVTDTGTGISEKLQSKIFDRFFTAIGTGQAAGIGLSFCKMVMESIGGDIECESKEGEYTTFRLTFPPVSDSEIPNRSS